jgi:hypothetical protein
VLSRLPIHPDPPSWLLSRAGSTLLSFLSGRFSPVVLWFSEA